MRATRAVINLGNLRHNIKSIKDLLKSTTKMCIAVKADAYGHGAVECAKAAVECGADYLAVATVDEGIELRQNGIQLPLLILSVCSPEEIPSLIEYSITPFVFDRDYIKRISDECSRRSARGFEVHLAVDTGMGRIGVLPEEAGETARFIEQEGVLKLAGMATHFAVSDSLTEDSKKETEIQFNKFMTAINNVKEAGINPGICHCANSAATLYYPEMQLDMVRPGIIVYGYYADEVNKKSLEEKGVKIDLKPVMTLETEVCAIRRFTPGMTVGYGKTWMCSEETDIAVLPVGYADGWLRKFSTSGVTVMINGKECPIRGRICMDQCMVDLGLESGVKNWDKVILFGSKENGAAHDADEIASMTGTISYEITSCITKRVPRVFTN